jgi:hypothetical protein
MITTPVPTSVVAPTFASPSRVTYDYRTINPKDSPRYYENSPSGGKLLYTNPTFPGGYVASPPATAVYNPVATTTTAPFSYTTVASPQVYTQPVA